MGDFALVIKYLNEVIQDEVEQSSVNQDITTTAGKDYILIFYINFFQGEGYIGLKIDQNLVYTVDATDYAGPYLWNRNVVYFSASRATTNIRFEFFFAAALESAGLDQVSVQVL